jgi:hypothetical protein
MKVILKHIHTIGIAAVLLTLAAGCSKYIDKEPLDQFSDLDYWNSEDNVKAFCWGFYNDIVIGYSKGAGFGRFYFSTFADDQISSSFQNFDKNAPSGDDNWDFDDVRKANLVMDRVNSVPMDQTAKNHWNGVAHFFRAWVYFRLVKRFGDVPWYSKVLDISQDSAIYKPRDPRNMVMDSVLADLNFAIANLRSKADADANTINKDVALALKSRVCLYEGTYSEYNEKDNARAATYLEQCKDASTKLMDAGYSLSDAYRSVYNSNDVSGNPEIILYKKYVTGTASHSVVGYTNSTTVMSGLNRSAINSYLCTDGLPIDLSPEYKGDEGIKNVRANRDGRLTATIDTFLCYQGNLVYGMSSTTGYRIAKFLPDGVVKPGDVLPAPYNETDAPIFWIAEIYENYAEASAELDKLGKYTITQHDLDISVNLLRKRGHVDSLELSGHQGTAVNGVVFVDPKKDADVTSLIWEIRRDRRDELMMDGLRFDDLIRWHKLDYMDSQKNPDIFVGAKVPANPDITLNTQGYLLPYSAGTERTVQPRDYLSPIPTGQISLYTNGELKQNMGW